MIPRPELHVADRGARDRIRLDLRRHRAEQNMRAVDVAAEIGVKKSAFQRLELTTTWTVPRVQAWSRVLAHRFVMDIEGLVVPTGDGNVRAAILAATTTFGGLDEDQLHLFTTVNNLIWVRKRSGLTLQDVADRMQVTDNAIRGWEKDHTATHVRSVQRYARALGGAVGLGLDPVMAVVS